MSIFDDLAEVVYDIYFKTLCMLCCNQIFSLFLQRTLQYKKNRGSEGKQARKYRKMYSTIDIQYYFIKCFRKYQIYKIL